MVVVVVRMGVPADVPQDPARTGVPVIRVPLNVIRDVQTLVVGVVPVLVMIHVRGVQVPAKVPVMGVQEIAKGVA